MEDRETARMRKYGESKTTRIMMATVPHVIPGLGLRKFQADGFLLTRVYKATVDETAEHTDVLGSSFSFEWATNLRTREVNSAGFLQLFQSYCFS